MGTPEREADGQTIPPCGCSTPGDSDGAICYCGVEDLLRIIRRRYSLAVMNAIHAHRPARYKTIAEALPGASSSTLADTLRALEAGLLISRRSGATPTLPPTYVLNPSGVRLLSRLRRLLGEVHGE